jgi:uncharacterized protein (DUF1697 family)
MAIYVALLRGINVAGHNMIAMAELRTFAEGLGLKQVRTLLQSGNLIFESPGRTPAKLEQLLEKESKTRFGVAIDYIVRSANELHEAISDNPFEKMAEEDPSHLVCMFLKRAPAAESVKSLQSSIVGPEVVKNIEKHLYVTYPAGIGQSKLTNVRIEKRLGVRGTARNWNTVRKLAAIVGE